MARYALDVVHPDGVPTTLDGVDLADVVADVEPLTEQWMREDRMIFGAGLKPAATARTVRVDDDLTTLVTDGPHVEAKEVIGGFWVLRAEPDEITDMARAAARACRTTIEIRELEDEPEA